MQGEFSVAVNSLTDAVTETRMHVEAAIDFPEEEIDFLADTALRARIEGAIELCAQIAAKARQGALLREGMTVVIAGRPNAGKSSLLNRLAGYDAAIVTDDSRNDARRAARTDRNRRHAAARRGYRGASRRGRHSRSGRHPPRAPGDDSRGSHFVCRRRDRAGRGTTDVERELATSADGRSGDAGHQQDRPARERAHVTNSRSLRACTSRRSTGDRAWTCCASI